MNDATVKAKGAGKVAAKTTPVKKERPSFIRLVVLPLIVIAPILFSAFIFLSRNYAKKLFPFDSGKPTFLVFPYIGASLFPSVIGLALYIYRSVKGMNCLVRFFIWVACAAGVFAAFAHCFLTFSYGNVNNDSWTNSVMIDVIAPPSAFNTFKNLPDVFSLSTDPKKWSQAEIVSGPHFDNANVRDAECGPRSFVRFMFHSFHPRASLYKVVGDTVVGGVWLAVDGTDSSRYGIALMFLA